MDGLDFTWDVAKKKGDGSSLFVGTSPAFDFALFSVCALSLFKPPHQLTECTCRIHKTILRITAKEISVKEKKVFTPKGKVSTAYPSAVIGKLNIAQCSRTYYVLISFFAFEGFKFPIEKNI